MTEPLSLDAAAVTSLAAAVALPMTAERAEAVAPQLEAWLLAANELNRKMASPRHAAVTPITTFTHPHQGVEE